MNPEPTPTRLRATRPLPNWTRRLAAATCATAYMLVLAGANLLTSTLGLMPAGFGLTVPPAWSSAPTTVATARVAPATSSG